MTGFKEGPSAEGPPKLFSADPTNAICGVTVDQAGDLYVGETTISGSQAIFTIHKYHPTANPVANADNVANFAVSSFNTTLCALAAGAGPSAGYIFSSGSNTGQSPGVFKLNASTGAEQYALAIKDSEGKEIGIVAKAITVDPASGYVFAGTQTEVLEYDASGSKPPLPRLATDLEHETQGLAADASSGDLYVARQGSSQLDTYGPALIVPDVTTEAASEVTGTTATLNGTINAASGPNASCHFQYTSEAAYLADKAISGHDGFAGALSAGCEPAGPFTGPATNAVSAEVTGLNPEAKYEFRLLGENTNGESQGKAKGYETLGKPQVEGGIASEVTTTTAKITGEVNPRGLASTFAVQYVTQAEFEASGYAGASTTPEAEAGSGSGFLEVSQELSGLQPLTAYHFRLVAKNESGAADPGEDGTFTTFPEATGLPEGRAYEQVSPALKLGEVFPPFNGGNCSGCTPGWVSEKTAMQASPDGNAVAYEGFPFAGGLASAANEYIADRGEGAWATTPLSTPQFTEIELREGFRAFSNDLSRGVVRQIEPALTPDAPADYANLYLWRAGGALEPLVTEAPPSRDPGFSNTGFVVTYAGANAGTPSTQAFSRLVFEANDALTEEVEGIAPPAPAVGPGETDLYEWSGGQLRLVNVLPGNNAAAPNATIGSGNLLLGPKDPSDFDHAISADGSRVFFSQKPSGQVYVREAGTSTTKVPDPGKFLTASADGSKVLLSDGVIFDLEDESSADLTGGQGGFQGILGTSEDLSRVYFVDTKALTPAEEENANGEAAEEGEFNLYLSGGESRTFIGALREGDNETWQPSPGSRAAQVSADGRYLAFASHASLTGSLGKLEVFEYDAQAESLSCASCNPSGEAPLGGSKLALVGPVAAELFPQPHNLPDEGQGRLFFESRDRLSVADHNGSVQDVYEWQPQGVGGCGIPRGCVNLISSGQGPQGPHAFNEDSYFLDASASGKDVFFTTWNSLVPFDKDNLMDLYDARAGGGFEFSAQEPCLGKACRGACKRRRRIAEPRQRQLQRSALQAKARLQERLKEETRPLRRKEEEETSCAP